MNSAENAANTQATPEASTEVGRTPHLKTAKPWRLWPAVAAIAVYWTSTLVVASLQTSYFVGFFFYVGAVAVLTLFFTIWWWASRTIPVRKRL